MAALFVTATGTDIGKTFVCAGLAARLRARGGAVEVLKPLVTGFDAGEFKQSDPGVLLAAAGWPLTIEEIARIAPWRFAAPLSPDLAAAREGREIDFDALVDFCRERIRAARGPLLIEGIGGVMVPLNSRHTVLDWMAELKLRTILVAGSYLGSLSHTLSCLDVLRTRGLVPRALIVNETPHATVTIEDTIKSLSQFAGDVPIWELPRNAGGASEATFQKILSLIQ